MGSMPVWLEAPPKLADHFREIDCYETELDTFERIRSSF